MTLKIISTEDILFEGEVTAVHLPGQAGRFTVLRNHATLIAALAAGTVGYEVPTDTESCRFKVAWRILTATSFPYVFTNQSVSVFD